jgi:hypothetical protein
MSYQEKKNIVSLIGPLLVFGFYCLYVFQKYPVGSLDSTDTSSFWGAFILILIPVSIVAKIIITIVFNIRVCIRTGWSYHAALSLPERSLRWVNFLLAITSGNYVLTTMK